MFRQMASKEKRLRLHNRGEWDDYYSPTHMEGLRMFFDLYPKGTENGWEITPQVRLSFLVRNTFVGCHRWFRASIKLLTSIDRILGPQILLIGRSLIGLPQKRNGKLCISKWTRHWLTRLLLPTQNLATKSAAVQGGQN